MRVRNICISYFLICENSFNLLVKLRFAKMCFFFKNVVNVLGTDKADIPETYLSQ